MKRFVMCLMLRMLTWLGFLGPAGFSLRPIRDWAPILDEETEPKVAPTIEEIEKLVEIEELKEAAFLIETQPLTAVQRQALRAAIETQARTLGVSAWDWTPYDGGRMLEVAAEMTQGMTDAMATFGGPVTILDDVNGNPLRIRFKGSQANAVTGNRMLYRRPMLGEAVLDVDRRAKARRVNSGEEGHPEQFQGADGVIRFKVTPANQIISPFKVLMDAEGQVIVDAEVIETTDPGRRLAADVRARRPVYFSTRAMGADWSEAVMDGKTIRLPGRMYIDTWDRVGNPAVHDATVLAVLDEAQVAALIQPPKAAPKEGTAVLTAEQIAKLKVTPDGRKALVSMLDSADAATKILILDALTEAPAPASAPDATQIQALVNQAITDATAKATEAATAVQEKKTEAWTYVQDEVAKLDRFDEKLKTTILDELKDCPDKAAAEVLLRQQIRIADNVVAGLHAAGLGFGGMAGNPILHMQINEKAPWTEVSDKLVEAFDDWRWQSKQERVDKKLREVNKPFVDKLMRVFDARNVLALTDSVKAWHTVTDAITSSDLYNAAIVQRAILVQAFGDADMLQFLGTDVFEGQTMQVPVEYVDAGRAAELDADEMGSILEVKVKTAWLNFSPTPRRVRTEISNDAQFRMLSGGLKYDVTARSLFHIAALMRRTINKAGGNEMLRASDAYGAVTKTAEVCVAGQVTAVANGTNLAWKIQPAASGTTGAPVVNIPLVRPRAYTRTVSDGAESQATENPIVVAAGGNLAKGYLADDGNIVSADGALLANAWAADYETGVIYVSSGGTMNNTTVLPTITYSYATNYVNFSLTVPGGVKPEDYYNQLLQMIDLQAALMAKKPRYGAPNLVLGSLTAMTYPALAGIFYKLNSPEGSVLTPGTGNYIASRNSLDYAKHNTDWQAGDARILLGRTGVTKYGVRDPFRLEGPAPSYDANRKMIAAKQWMAEEHSALVTPEVRDQAGKTLNPAFRTIRLS